MTLYTTDYLEYYLTLVGWVINNGIWNILVASGVFALPFVAIVIHEWLRARAQGADEGNKGVLSSMRIENRVWVAIMVIMFAGILRDLQGVLDSGLPTWAAGVAAPPSVAGLVFVGWQEPVGCGGVAVFPGDTIGRPRRRGRHSASPAGRGGAASGGAGALRGLGGR